MYICNMSVDKFRRYNIKLDTDFILSKDDENRSSEINISVSGWTQFAFRMFNKDKNKFFKNNLPLPGIGSFL